MMDTEDRMTGRTTRLVDYYVQKLFENRNDFIKVEDHCNTRMANEYLMMKIARRLKSEHNIDVEIRHSEYMKIKTNR